MGSNRKLKVASLISQGYWKPTAQPVRAGYTVIQDDDGNDIAFAGQHDPATGKPDGVVRAVYYSGGIYEGQMTPDGKPNGWGILYAGAFIRVGWWQDFA